MCGDSYISKIKSDPEAGSLFCSKLYGTIRSGVDIIPAHWSETIGLYGKNHGYKIVQEICKERGNFYRENEE